MEAAGSLLLIRQPMAEIGHVFPENITYFQKVNTSSDVNPQPTLKTTTKEGLGVSIKSLGRYGASGSASYLPEPSPQHPSLPCRFPAGSARPRSLAVLLGAHQRSRREGRNPELSLTYHQKDRVPTAASTAELLSELDNQTLDNLATRQSRR